MEENKSFNIQKLHAVQLEILKEFSRVCEQEEILWFPFFGSLIGTVRHDGFIPWDDDIDLIVRYKDYEKLMNSADKLFKYPFFFQTTKNDPQYKAVFAKLRKSDTTLITENLSSCDINHGVSIDIYPAINASDNPNERKKQEFFTRLYYLTHIDSSAKNHGMAIKIVTRLFSTLCPQILKKKLENIAFKNVNICENENTKEFYVLSGAIGYIDHTYSNLIFRDYFKHRFEDLEVRIPRNYDEALRRDYGDYMELPPEDERGVKLESFLKFDPTKSYLEYKGIYYCKNKFEK